MQMCANVWTVHRGKEHQTSAAAADAASPIKMYFAGSAEHGSDMGRCGHEDGTY